MTSAVLLGGKPEERRDLMHKRRLLNLLIVVIILGGLLFPTVTLAKEPTIALVLGGGSARGYSHIGLLRAFEENGIPVDLLLSTSMGSIIASLYAAGYSIENMTQVAHSLNIAMLLDFPLPPSGGLADSKGIAEYLDILFSRRTYDELPTSFYSIMVNLHTGEELALNHGKVSKGVMASITVPVLFPPVEVDGGYYVDGGLRNQVPANIARNLGADVIIAVSLGKDYEDPSFTQVVENLFMTLTVLVEGYTPENIAEADVIIRPPVMYDNSLDFQRISYFIDHGYKAAMEQMDEIKATILAHDPDFEFVPRKQEGVSSSEMTRRLRDAEIGAANLAKRFTVKPVVDFSYEYSFPTLGLKLTNGPFGYFGAGYRYGFHNLEGGHELFIDWEKSNVAFLEASIRKSPDREKPTFGLALTGPKTSPLLLEASYVSQGRKAWQISASHLGLFDSSKLRAGLSLRLTGLRPEEDVTAKNELFLAAAPQIQVFPWGKHYFPLGLLVFSRPYLLAGVTFEFPLTKPEAKPSFRLGLGSELRLFGLYPGDVSLGIEVDNKAQFTWRFGLKNIRF